jgi:hypothetical protein
MLSIDLHMDQRHLAEVIAKLRADVSHNTALIKSLRQDVSQRTNDFMMADYIERVVQFLPTDLVEK